MLFPLFTAISYVYVSNLSGKSRLYGVKDFILFSYNVPPLLTSDVFKSHCDIFLEIEPMKSTILQNFH